MRSQDAASPTGEHPGVSGNFREPARTKDRPRAPEECSAPWDRLRVPGECLTPGRLPIRLPTLIRQVSCISLQPERFPCRHSCTRRRSRRSLPSWAPPEQTSERASKLCFRYAKTPRSLVSRSLARGYAPGPQWLASLGKKEAAARLRRALYSPLITRRPTRLARLQLRRASGGPLTERKRDSKTALGESCLRP